MLRQGSVGDVIVDQEKPPRVATVTVELHQVRVVDRGEDEDLVTEGLGRESGGGVVAVEVLHRRKATVAELREVDGPKPAVPDFPLGVEVVGSGSEVVVGEDRGQETGRAVVVEEECGGVLLRGDGGSL